MQRRILAVVLLVAVAAAAYVPTARAAAEVHKLNLVISAAPSEIKTGDLNKDLDYINDTFLEPFGLKGLDRITYGWLFDAELRYQIRPNWALCAGVGQIRQQTQREYLPALQQSIQLRSEIMSIPIRTGALYYFAPYNQGDFQARGFFGGGMLVTPINRAVLQQTSTLGAQGNFVQKYNGPSPGWFAEGGVHLYFASRFSVMMSALYRESKSRKMEYTQFSQSPDLISQPVITQHDGRPFELDSGGIGFRMAVGYGL